MNAIMQKVFEHRGYTQDFIDNLDNPSHPVLKDTDKIVNRLKTAHDAGEKVIIIPDFDMDGIMSGVIGMAALDEMGFNVKLHVPNPQRGYGFDHEDIDEITERHPDAKVIITCDTGITCYAGVECANERGIDVLVTDHHIPNDDLPAALAVVDPYLDDAYELKGICGAHVMWQTMVAYARARTDAAEQTRIDRLRVFAGIGTVSDSMPLLHENRQLVRDAIRLTKLVWCGGNRDYVSSIDGTPFYRAAFLGLYEVLDGLKSIGKLHEIDEDLFGFYLAPTFNAIKRMGGSLQRAFLTFFTTDRITDDGITIDMSSRRREHVDYLIALNEERKQTVEQVVEDTLSREQPYAPYIYITEVDGGMAGLVAGKLEGDSGMPCVVVSWDNDHYAGSGRAPSWIDFKAELNSIDVKASGHAQAFGIRFDTDDEIKAAYEHVKQVCDKAVAEGIAVERVEDVTIGDGDDADFPASLPLLFEFASELEDYRPFGHGFEQPLVKLRFKPSSGEWRTIGSDGAHVKISLDNGMSVIVWGGVDDKLEQRKQADELELVGNVSLNTFRGVSNVDFTASGWGDGGKADGGCDDGDDVDMDVQ